MTLHLHAVSASRPALALLQRRPFAARVLAVFARACDLVTAESEVLALVTPAMGDGPLNVVLAGGSGPPLFPSRGAWGRPQSPPAPDRASVDGTGWSWFERDLAAGMPVTLDGETLQVGGLLILLAGAQVWEPRPDWAALRARREAIAGRLSLVQAAALEQAAEESLLARLSSALYPPHVPGGRGEALASLRAGWAGDEARLREGAAQLAGLGGGLTPAGDDFLCGAMLAAWLFLSDPEAFCRVVVEAAAPRTTTLSAALLRAAGRGECSAAWHNLLGALAEEDRGEVFPPAVSTHLWERGDEPFPPTRWARGNTGPLHVAIQSVLAHGATSGADTLAGFLWGTGELVPERAV
jgi:hypothetical protein